MAYYWETGGSSTENLVWVLRLITYTHTHTHIHPLTSRGYEKIITYIIKAFWGRTGQISQDALKLLRARKGDWLGALIVVKG